MEMPDNRSQVTALVMSYADAYRCGRMTQVQIATAFNADDSSMLVLIRAFAGDAYHCVENRYL